MDVYIGLDISLKTTQVCVVDAEGRPVEETATASDPDAVDSWLRARGDLSVGTTDMKGVMPVCGICCSRASCAGEPWELPV